MWCYSKPQNFYEEVKKELGEFDLKWYWGPFVSIESSRWIINASKITIKKHNPDLLLTYIPHLDYSGQKFGPESSEFKKSVLEVDGLIGNLEDFLKTEKLDYEIRKTQDDSLNAVIEQAKNNFGNEYDAAIMFMIVKMNSLNIGSNDSSNFVSKN